MHIKDVNEKTYKIEIKFTLEVSKNFVAMMRLSPLTFEGFRDSMIDLIYNYRYAFNKDNLNVRIAGKEVIGVNSGQVQPLPLKLD